MWIPFQIDFTPQMVLLQGFGHRSGRFPSFQCSQPAVDHFLNIRWDGKQSLGIDPSDAKSNIIVQLSLHSFVISLGIDGLVEFHDPTWIYPYKPIHISMQSYKYIDK